MRRLCLPGFVTSYGCLRRRGFPIQSGIPTRFDPKAQECELYKDGKVRTLPFSREGGASSGRHHAESVLIFHPIYSGMAA